MYKITIWDNEANQRFDRFLRKLLKPYPIIKLSHIFWAIRKWKIKLNWKKSNQEKFLVSWDEISFFDDQIVKLLKNPSKDELRADIDVKKVKSWIVYEDENYIFFNKPADMVVHPWNKHTDDLTLTDILHRYCESYTSTTFKPQFAFRLDRDTSWLIVACKNFEALQYLTKIIRERQVEKKYLAILVWRLEKKIQVDAPLFKGFNSTSWKWQTFVNFEKWLESSSIFEPKKYFSTAFWDLTLTEVKILTWRMHQIRVHAAHIKHPVLWDLTYGIPSINRKAKDKKILRQLLHSYEYGFYDIFSKKNLKIVSPIPDFVKIFD